MIAVAFTEATLMYDEPTSTEIKSPACTFAAAFAVPFTLITVAPETTAFALIESVTDKLAENACEEAQIETRRLLPNAPAYLAATGPRDVFAVE